MTPATKLTIPPLPATWPYEPRTAEPVMARRAGVEIPGMGGGWTLLAPEGLRLRGEAEALGDAFGRGGVRRMGEVVLRPYKRGGMVRHVNEGTYPSPDRFIHELEIHRALRAAGFPTVEPLGCAWRKRGWGVEGVYFTRFEAGTPWPRAWERSDEVLLPLRQAIDALAAWGLHAPDLNATNVMIGTAGDIVLLDWDRAVFRPSNGLVSAYLSRLSRSVVKLGAPGRVAAQLR